MTALVLVVDDDPQVLRLLQINFEMEGYDVVSASSGEEALDVLSREEPDVVVCDVMMPGIDGFEVVRRIRVDDGDLPIVLLSAKAQRSDIAEGMEAGADRYVTKPFDPTELVDTVAELVERRSPA